MATRKPLVLVIDKDLGIRRLVRVVLESSAFGVALATTRADALAQARAHRPEVILMDPAAHGLDA